MIKEMQIIYDFKKEKEKYVNKLTDNVLSNK